MIQYLIVLLDSSAPSFCYYTKDPAGALGESTQRSSRHVLSEAHLKKIINYARDKHLIINFIFGKEPLPGKHLALIDKTEHIKMVPLELAGMYDQGICIIDKSNAHLIRELSTVHGGNLQGGTAEPEGTTAPGKSMAHSNRNIILGLEKNEIKNCARVVKQLIGKFKRLNLHLIDIPVYEDKHILQYKEQLEEIASELISEYKKGNAYECNFLSDRILLDHMQNCNAGIDHITFAPDGQFYLCPGFYYSGDQHAVEYSEEECTIKDASALTLENAPICSLCDCYHCKRCYYLNKQATMQLNTPSYQQCVLSHHERNTSRKVLAALHKLKEFKALNHIPPIPEIDYLDPFQLITKEAKKAVKEMPELKQGVSSERAGNKETHKDNNNSIGKTGVQKIHKEQIKVNNTQNQNLKGPDIHRDKQKQFTEKGKKEHISGSVPGMMSLQEFKNLSTKEMLIEIFKVQQKILKEYTIRDEK